MRFAEGLLSFVVGNFAGRGGCMTLGTLGSTLLRAEILGLIAMVGVIAAVLYRLKPEDRTSLRNTIALGLVGMTGVVLAAALMSCGLDASANAFREASVILIGMAVIRLCGQVIFRVLLPFGRLQAPRILEDLVVIVAYVAWGFIRLRLAGLDLSGIVATSAVITAIIAFSVQDTLGNILGGLALELDSGFEVGDWIRVDDVVGQVIDIRWRSVSIQTRNWETVIVPNSHMVRSKVAVLGRRAGAAYQARRWIWFNVSLATSPTKVMEVVTQALQAAAIANMASEPTPNCVLMEFERGYARYAVRYWLTDIEKDDPTDSAVREHILAALQRAGLRIAVPEQNVHVVAEDHIHAEQVAARELNRRRAALQGIDLFSELTEEEIGAVASRLVPSPFAEGDVITRQGACAHWLYILSAGSVSVALERPDGGRHGLATLEAPTVFGEMGLLTGEPRQATVIARTGAQCYRLDKAAFQQVLLERPLLAERMARILAERQSKLDREVDQLSRGRAQAGAAHMHDEILERIKRFFSIKTG